jgi:hypothetical protein
MASLIICGAIPPLPNRISLHDVVAQDKLYVFYVHYLTDAGKDIIAISFRKLNLAPVSRSPKSK